MPSESSMDVARMTRDIETRHFLRLTDDGQTTIVQTGGVQKRVGGGMVVVVVVVPLNIAYM